MTSRSAAAQLSLNRWRAVLLFPLLVATLFAVEAPRVRESFDSGWRFLKSDALAAEQAGFDDGGWRRLSLPHDWSIEGPFDEKAPTGGPGGYLPTGVGWYRKHFTVPETLRGREISVEFDGVYMNSDVWINGRHLGRWPYGYSGFAYELTPFLNFGDQPNVLTVRVDNSAQPNSRWYSGSGIYRHVWITITNAVHVAHWGTYVTTPEVSAQAATVRIRTRVQNDGAEVRTVTLVSELLDAAGQVTATAQSDDRLPAGGEREFDQAVTVTHPRLWSPDTPDLYRVRSRVQTGGRIVDSYETPVGIRTIAYDVDRGFLLNDQPVKLQGMCLHHDGGAVGAAVPEDVWGRRLHLLKDMGCNAIRTSHNPPAPEFLDLCDQLGFLVMDEAFDEWTIRKGQILHGYSEFFNEWYARDLGNMIHRDRNHPSVILWSAGNEIGEQRVPGGEKVLAKLVEVLHREDPTRPVTAAMDNIYTDEGEAPAAFSNLLDIVGYNYVDRWGPRRETLYAADRQKYPQRKFVGTENVCIGGMRGSYELPSAPADGGPRPPRYATAMVRGEQVWRFTRLADYVVGDFLWTGIDYLGESRWPRRSSFSGVLDTCGFAKDGYYFYQSQWTARPVLHLFPHWNWPGHEGQVIPVIAYSNCDTVELFLNRRSLGAKAHEFPRQGTSGGWNTYARPQVLPTTADLHLAWDVAYERGVLKAVGYRDGKQVAETEIRTAGPAAMIALSADRNTLRAGLREVANVTVEVRDASGTIVPTADNLIRWEVQGDAVLVGVDNGDPLSHENFQGHTGKAFNGLALGIVQAGAKAGEVRVHVAADGLKAASVVLQVVENPDAARSAIVGLDE